MNDTRGPPPRVLCIDDNRDVADSTAEVLLLPGYEARACYGGPAASSWSSPSDPTPA